MVATQEGNVFVAFNFKLLQLVYIMKSIVYIQIFLLLVLSQLTLVSWAHEGHSHGEEQEVPAETLLASRTEASDGRFEVLLKFMPVEQGQPLEMRLYVSDYKTNTPIRVEGVSLAYVAGGDQPFALTEKELGIYAVQTTMPEEKKFDMVCRFLFNQEQFSFSLSGVDFAHYHTAHAAEHEHSHLWMYLTGGGLLILGLLLGRYTAVRKYQKQMAAVAMLLALPLFEMDTARAHEAPTEPKKANAGLHGQEFELAKESQFLMQVLTEVAGESSYQDGRKLYGTVIPSLGGQSHVVLPQHCKITQLKVRPGEAVAAGSVLALVERTMDPAGELALQAERNRLREELVRLKSEVERLRKVGDIVSKKELEAAESAYTIAKNNMELYDGNGKSLTVKAPISGIVAPFTFQVGDFVNGGQELMTITNIDKVYIETQAFERDISMIESASKFLAQCTDGNHTSEGVRLLSMGSEFNSANQSQKVIFELDNANRDFKIGEFVNLWVYAGMSDGVVAAPNSAVTELQGRPAIIVKKGAELLEVRYVALGRNNGQNTVIESGLKVGERLVTEGAYQCKLAYLND